jgi:hypothetical protein
MGIKLPLIQKVSNRLDIFNNVGMFNLTIVIFEDVQVSAKKRFKIKG